MALRPIVPHVPQGSAGERVDVGAVEAALGEQALDLVVAEGVLIEVVRRGTIAR
jgi:hypothetical protein